MQGLSGNGWDVKPTDSLSIGASASVCGSQENVGMWGSRLPWDSSGKFFHCLSHMCINSYTHAHALACTYPPTLI